MTDTEMPPWQWHNFRHNFLYCFETVHFNYFRFQVRVLFFFNEKKETVHAHDIKFVVAVCFFGDIINMYGLTRRLKS